MVNKLNKFLKSNYTAGILSGLVVALVIYFSQNINFIPEIYDTNDNVKMLTKNIDSLNSIINEIRNNYLAKDEDGIEVYVGINNDLSENTISVFTNNSCKLEYSDAIILTNPIDNFSPSIKLVVCREIERNGDLSKAQIFISKEASELLGFFRNNESGIMKLSVKKLLKQ
jgi:hypothetical protein